MPIRSVIEFIAKVFLGLSPLIKHFNAIVASLYLSLHWLEANQAA